MSKFVTSLVCLGTMLVGASGCGAFAGAVKPYVATVTPTPVPTLTPAEVQAAVKINHATLTDALNIVHSGEVLSPSSNQYFLDPSGKVIPTGTFDSGGLENVTYVGSLTTSEQVTDKDTQPILLFATRTHAGRMVFIEIQFYSRARDGATYNKFEQADKNHVLPTEMRIEWSIKPFDPNSREYTKGSDYVQFNTIYGPLGLAEGDAYILNLNYDPSDPFNTAHVTGVYDPQDIRFTEELGFYEVCPVRDSLAASISTYNALVGNPSNGSTALLSTTDILDLYNDSNTTPLALPNLQGIAPFGITRGN